MKKRQFIINTKYNPHKEVTVIEQIFNGRIEKREPLIRLGGFPLEIIEEELIFRLKQAGYNMGTLQSDEFVLQEEEGIRVALLFQLIKPLRKIERIEKIKEGLENMESEEIYYWYSLSNRDKKKHNASKALRILLSGG